LALAALALSSAAQAQDGRVWSVQAVKGEPALLAYAAPDSEDLGVSLSCPRGTGQITVTSAIERRLADHLRGETWVDKLGHPAPWPARVALSSGAASATLRGQANPDEMNGGSTLTTEVSSAAPVIKAFRKTGVLKVAALGETLAPPAAATRMVRTFLGACR